MNRSIIYIMIGVDLAILGGIISYLPYGLPLGVPLGLAGGLIIGWNIMN